MCNMLVTMNAPQPLTSTSTSPYVSVVSVSVSPSPWAGDPRPSTAARDRDRVDRGPESAQRSSRILTATSCSDSRLVAQEGVKSIGGGIGSGSGQRAAIS